MSTDGHEIEHVRAQVNLIIEETIKLLESLSGKLYRMPIRILSELNPSLEEMAEVVDLIGSKAQELDYRLNFISEAAGVLYEASTAVGNGCERTLIDCAYHLEDVISRVRGYTK